MVVSFIGLSLLPTILIFYFSFQLIGQDQETWFSSTIKESLEQALSVAEFSRNIEVDLVKANTEKIAADLSSLIGTQETLKKGLKLSKFLSLKLKLFNLSAIEIYDSEGKLIDKVGRGHLKPIDPLWFQNALKNPMEVKASKKQEDKKDDKSETIDENQSPVIGPDALGRFFAPITTSDGLKGFAATQLNPLSEIETNLSEIRQGLQTHLAALGISRPFRVTQMTSLAGVTLLAVFISIWIGSRLASSLAAPVTELVEGTRRVAKGELDFVLTPTHKSGEMAHLVSAFNQMTSELKESYSEIDRRRRFVETVLKQVSSGVLILDLENHLVNLNQAAREMLGLTYFKLEGGPEPAIIKTIVGPADNLSQARYHVFLELENKVLSLTLRRTTLIDEEGRALGYLVTFDDLSELEKAQRLAAWREVAKRIAHEIKNPLTPISLSAQRLRRRFAKRLNDEQDGSIFDECTNVIVRQVENMRNLVDEFSQFARLPEINPRPANFIRVIEELVSLFRGAHPNLTLCLNITNRPDTFIFDPEQIGRAVTNLLVNAAQATLGRGRLELAVDLDDLAGVTLTVADDGPGLPPNIRDRIFEPYVTSGQGGQGLGLAIVNAIIRDHGGYIRVSDNFPKGTIFIITLPYRLN
jgi:two-component system nitrogen regulation sensor histidine kinase NtrY